VRVVRRTGSTAGNRAVVDGWWYGRGMFGERRVEQRLRAAGVRTDAEIMSAHPGRFAHTDGPEAVVSDTELDWKVALRVTPLRGVAVDSEHTIRRPQLSPAFVGDFVPVIYDPADPTQLMVDDDPAAIARANARFGASMIKQGMIKHGSSTAAASKVADDAYLRTDGTSGQAVITAVTETGATGDYDSKELELQVEVTIAGRPAYTAVVRQFVGPMAMWKFAAGKSIGVAVDPKDDSHVVVGPGK
jgi:hypothetical protein